MKRILVLAAAASLLAGCGVSRTGSEPLWQRVEALRPLLASVTHESGRVTRDMSALGRAVSRGGRIRVKLLSHQTRVDALRLTSLTRLACHRLEPLARRSPRNSPQARFLDQVLRALKLQGAEGRQVASMASVLWVDPYLVSPADAVTFARFQRQADNSAWNASRAVRQASSIRRASPGAFRYVRTESPSGATTSGT